MSKIIFRILNFPFVFCTIVIAGLTLIIRATWNYCKNGGEYIMYQDGKKKLIVDIYDELKKQHKKHLALDEMRQLPPMTEAEEQELENFFKQYGQKQQD